MCTYTSCDRQDEHVRQVALQGAHNSVEGTCTTTILSWLTKLLVAGRLSRRPLSISQGMDPCTDRSKDIRHKPMKLELRGTKRGWYVTALREQTQQQDSYTLFYVSEG